MEPWPPSATMREGVSSRPTTPPIPMAYDPLDRLLIETTTMGTVNYQYDAISRRTSMTVSGQAPVAYTYDANSRLRTFIQAPLNPADIQYDASGRRTLLT